MEAGEWPLIRSVVDRMTDGVCIASNNGKILYLNQKMRRLIPEISEEKTTIESLSKMFKGLARPLTELIDEALVSLSPVWTTATLSTSVGEESIDIETSGHQDGIVIILCKKRENDPEHPNKKRRMDKHSTDSISEVDVHKVYVVIVYAHNCNFEWLFRRLWTNMSNTCAAS